MKLDQYLKLDRCPHCSVDKPNLNALTGNMETVNDRDEGKRYWKFYKCARCGGVVTAACSYYDRERTVSEIYPKPQMVDERLPDRVKSYLQQAINSIHTPAGSVMLCASAVDSMLKEKGLIDGSLYSRINTAITNGLMTPEMATWAHQVRLDANDQRHADESNDLPTTEDAQRLIEFTQTLAEFLFVLPAKVTRGIQSATVKEVK